MTKPFIPLAFAFLLIASGRGKAQTDCGIRHSKPGVFICYPNPAEDPADADIPDFFHFSAQVNSAEGQAVRRYSILIDGRVVYQSRLPGPLKNLSIETNLKSRFKTNSHSVGLVVYGAGSAEVSGLRIHDSPDSMLCDPFSRTDPRACNLSKPAAPLRWKANTGNGAQDQPASAYAATLQTYSRNLKRLEADASDAIAVDGRGNLYTASHVLSDVEVRKYAPDGGVLYDAIVHSCGDGFVQVSGIAATDSGLVWIAANTTACFTASGNAFNTRSGQPNGMRGILMLVDTSKASSIAPPYLAWLAGGEYRVTAIRADTDGNAYVAGIAKSSDFPHQKSIDADARASASEKAEFGFVSVLSKSGPVLWSTLLGHVLPAALSVGPAGKVLVAGGGITGAILAEIADRGQRLSWVARPDGQHAREFSAVSMTTDGALVLLAAASEPEGGAIRMRKGSISHGHGMVFAAVHPCGADEFDFHPLPQSATEQAPGIALGAALDAMAAEWLYRSPPSCRPPA